VNEPTSLERDACWRLVAGQVVGRVGFDVGRGPRIHPMNYAVDGETVVLRTSEDSELELFTRLFAAGSLVAFEVDHVDLDLHQGWSVLMSGHVSPVESREELDRLRQVPTPRPWAGGERERLVRVTPVEVTGRRIGLR
jgi:uncharacterized protein